jgi:hypothetical protein
MPDQVNATVDKTIGSIVLKKVTTISWTNPDGSAASSTTLEDVTLTQTDFTPETWAELMSKVQ